MSPAAKPVTREQAQAAIVAANRRRPPGYTYCLRCDIVQPTIDDGETCAACLLVIPA